MRHHRFAARLRLCLNLTLETATGFLDSLSNAREHGITARRMGIRGLWRTAMFNVGWAADPYEYFALDGVVNARRRSQLSDGQRRQRDLLADRRRRRVAVLLHALGDSPQQVKERLTRDWLHSRADHPDLLEQYLLARLAGRDPGAGINIVEFGRVIAVGGTWVSLPAPVRAYLAEASTYERGLYQGSYLPRRGPRLLTTNIPDSHPRRCRCCLPIGLHPATATR